VPLMDALKKIFVLLVVAAAVATACGGGEETPQTDAAAPEPESEDCPTEATTTESGLKIRDIECGDGDEAAKGDTLEVHYEGRLEDGTKFDASRDHGSTFEFQVGAGQVIAGWDEGLVGMKVGGVRELTIPPELGYGAAGAPPAIPPNATLIFEVELVSIKSG
jgi:FKBP-type peptidyl-prolyl cis-trans isomerase